MSFAIEQENMWKNKNNHEFYYNWQSGIRRSKWFASFLSKYEFSSIYEIGCNSGRNIKFILDRFDVEAGGLDINAEAVNMAKLKTPAGTFEVGSAYDADVSKKYDIVFTMGTVIHIPPDRIVDFVTNCVEKANKYVIHIEQTTKNKDMVINGPKEMRPKKSVKPKFRWAPNLEEVYKNLGFDPVVENIPKKLRAEDLNSITIIKK